MCEHWPAIYSASRTYYMQLRLSTLRPTTASRLALALAPVSLFGAVPPALAAQTSAPAPAAVTVGDPAHPGDLAKALQEAYTGGARRIVIRRGVYMMPDVGHTAITLGGWQNATISAYGVTFILTDLVWGHDGIALNACTNVTFAGGLISQNQVTAYQGRVVAVGTDATGKPYRDWRPDAGYPVPNTNDSHVLFGDVNVVDAHTRLLKVGDGDFYGVKYEQNADGTFRAHLGGSVAVGDWLVGRYGNSPIKIHLIDCRDCTIKNVTLMRNGFAPLREENGGGNHYLHMVWALGPRPAKATENPVVTNEADGMHMTGSNPGPDIENCEFQGVFLDDCIAIHGSFQTVKGVSGATLTLEGGVGDLKIGQPARISDQKGFFAQGMVRAIKDNGDGTTSLTLDKDYRVPTAAKLSNPLADGAGYKIIGCHLGDTRSRGILAKADDGLIKGNVIENCGMSAVSLGPEYYWGEADYVHNVTVEDNVFRHVGGTGSGGAAVLVHGDGAVGNQDIIIRNNRMDGDYQGEFDVQWVDGVTISGNVIRGAETWPSTIPKQTMMHFANAQHITLRGNIVRNAGVYSTPLVDVGAATMDLTNDNATGVRIAKDQQK